MPSSTSNELSESDNSHAGFAPFHRRRGRIVHDLYEAAVSGFNIIPLKVATDYSWVEVRLEGPANTPYEGGKYVVVATFSPRFPTDPPQVYLKTKIWHVNVCSVTGLLNANTIVDWTPASTLLGVFREILGLLHVPVLTLFRDFWARNMFRTDFIMYQNTAAVWSRWFANGTVCSPDMEEKVLCLVREGATIDEAIFFLTDSKWNLHHAFMNFAFT